MLKAQKAAQRAAGKAARAGLTPEQRAAASAAVCEKLKADPRLQAARTVLVYHAVPPELSCAGLIPWLQARGIAVAYPRSIAPGVMEARIPLDDAPFTPDYYRIPAPDPAHSRLAAPAGLDVVLVPLTAFDAACRRVGMGAGVYDRFLPGCSGAALLGLAFSAQQVDAAACEPTDRPLHAVFTETAVFARK